ncbi:Protein-tyrosine phosphatase [Ancylostoma caninum]|uniref:Protein-tyrosine phosphatase n=1 Tax=Ancylostoma caninum TaxID=29170 RepID=A0A368GHF5_ANCCA|nr:Protein-tyrosine phosphatase [Ancylostoma caninum]
MTTRVKRGGVRTARARRRRITEATYEEPEGPSVPVPEPKGKRPATTARKAGANVGAEVEKHLDNFVETFTTLGVEGLRKQFKEELAAYRAPDDKYKFTAFEAHPDKNRYLDVVCLDETRVRLTLNVPPSTDYIHANWVKFEGHDKVFIATQCIEDGKIKGTQYWPLDAGQYQTYGEMVVNTKKVESEGKFLIYTVEVLPEGCSNSNIVKVLHMTSWPDRGLPMSGRHVLRLIRQVSGDRLDNGPIVMHCSAGIGRTGTIILIDIILRKLFSCQEVNLVELFKTLRNQRASCIQLEGQYVFIILSVLDYIKIKCPKYKEKVNKYMEDFRTALIPST